MSENEFWEELRGRKVGMLEILYDRLRTLADESFTARTVLAGLGEALHRGKRNEILGAGRLVVAALLGVSAEQYRAQRAAVDRYRELLDEALARESVDASYVRSGRSRRRPSSPQHEPPILRGVAARGVRSPTMTRRRTPSPSITSAVLYLRVSTDGQRVSGLGREAQEAACRAHCERQGWPVAAVYVDDGMSGTLPVERRPGCLAAVEHARRDGAAFVVYSLSRAARSVPELYRLAGGDLSVALVSVTESIDMSTAAGKLLVAVLAAVAEFEADVASERTMAALAAARARGVALGRPAVVAASSGAERARQLRGDGLSCREVARRLNEEHVPTATGAGRWHERTVRVAVFEGRCAEVRAALTL